MKMQNDDNVGAGRRPQGGTERFGDIWNREPLIIILGYLRAGGRTGDRRWEVAFSGDHLETGIASFCLSLHKY